MVPSASRRVLAASLLCLSLATGVASAESAPAPTASAMTASVPRAPGKSRSRPGPPSWRWRCGATRSSPPRRAARPQSWPRRYGGGGPVVVRANTRSAMVNGPDGIAAALTTRDPRRRPVARRAVPPADLAWLPGRHRRQRRRPDRLLPPESGACLTRARSATSCWSSRPVSPAPTRRSRMPTRWSSRRRTAPTPRSAASPKRTGPISATPSSTRRSAATPRCSQAFDDARAIVAAREAAQGFAPSNPQIAGRRDVLPLLDGTAER